MELRYRFAFPSGRKEEFVLQLDDKSLALVPSPAEAPEWTRLEYKQCPNCPLKPETSARCPVAVNLAPLVEAFQDTISHEEAQIEVTFRGRTITGRMDVQKAVSALFGVVMATSGCPILDHLRPMVFTHLPFSTMDETMYRAMSMYLLAQYLIAGKGGRPDWDMSGLASLYESIDEVNIAFAERLRAASIKDANANAIVHLDCFASFTAVAIQARKLDWLEALFKPYLAEIPK